MSEHLLDQEWTRRIAQQPGHDPEATLRPDSLTPPAQGSQTPGSVTPPSPGSTTRRRLRNGGMPSEVIGYRLGDVLGQGGQGMVHAAEQVALGRQVAVKIAAAASFESEDALRREAITAAAVEHPNVVAVHDAGEDFLVMRQVRGRTLSEVLRDGPVEPRLSELVELVARVGDAIACAHARGVMHRDLKPGNVMIGPYGEVLVLDWGLAVQLDAPGRVRLPGIPLLTMAQVYGGTPVYVPPEVARGDMSRIGFASDVFLLGAMLYRIVTGHAPFAGGSTSEALVRAARNQRPTLREAASWASPSLIALIDAAMADDPAQRPNVVAFTAQLRTWLRAHAHEREALVCVERATASLNQATQQSAPALVYIACAEGVAHADRALALWKDCPNAAELRTALLSAHARTAIASGDLPLATTIAQRIESAAAVAIRQDLATAQQLELRRRRRTARWIGLSYVSAVCGALTITALAWSATHAEHIAASQRRDQAEQLLRESEALPADESGLSARLSAAQRALGLDPTSTRAPRTAADSAAALCAMAIDRGQPDIAEARMGVIRLHDPQRAAALHIRIDAAQAVRRQRIAERRARWVELCDLVAGHGGERSIDPAYAATVEVASWDDRDVLATVRATLMDADSEPAARTLAAAVLGRSSDAAGQQALIAALDDRTQAVSDAAAAALVRRGGAPALNALERWLRTLRDPLRALVAGSRLHHAGLSPRDATMAFLIGDFAAWRAAVTRDPPRDVQGLQHGARVLRWVLGDVAAARTFAEQAVALQPGNAHVAADLADIWRAQGSATNALAVLDACAKSVATKQAHILLPQRLHALLDLPLDLSDNGPLSTLVATMGKRVGSDAPWYDRHGEMQTALERCLRVAAISEIAVQAHHGKRFNSGGGNGMLAALTVQVLAMRQHGELDAAARLTRAATALLPGDSAVLLMAHDALRDAGQQREAQRMLAEAQRINPNSPQVLVLGEAAP